MMYIFYLISILTQGTEVIRCVKTPHGAHTQIHAHTHTHSHTHAHTHTHTNTHTRESVFKLFATFEA